MSLIRYVSKISEFLTGTFTSFYITSSVQNLCSKEINRHKQFLNLTSTTRLYHESVFARQQHNPFKPGQKTID